jgi:hypothetical protein
MPIFENNHGGKLIYTSDCDETAYNADNFLRDKARYLIDKSKKFVNSMFDVVDYNPEYLDKANKIVNFMNGVPFGKALLLPNCDCNWKAMTSLASDKRFDELFDQLNGDLKNITNWVKSKDFSRYYNTFNDDLKRIADFTINFKDSSPDIQK